MPYLERAMKRDQNPALTTAIAISVIAHRCRPVRGILRKFVRVPKKPALSAAVTGLPHLPRVRRFRFSADLGPASRRTRRRCGQRGLGGRTGPCGPHPVNLGWVADADSPGYLAKETHGQVSCRCPCCTTRSAVVDSGSLPRHGQAAS